MVNKRKSFFTQYFNRYWQWLAAMAAAFFPLYVLYIIFIKQWWINLPYMDWYDFFLPLLKLKYLHEFSWDLWLSPLNYHRILFERFLHFIDYQFFSGNRLPLLLFMFSVQLLIYILLLFQVKKIFSPKDKLFWLLLFSFSAILFAPQLIELWVGEAL